MDKRKLLLSLVLVSMSIFIAFALYQAVFTGYVTFTFESEQVKFVEEYFEFDALIPFEKENVKEINITGYFEGEKLEINAFTSKGIKRIYSSDSNTSFSGVCEETCDLSESNVSAIEVLVNGTLFVEKINYVLMSQDLELIMMEETGNFTIPTLYWDVDGLIPVNSYENLTENEQHTFYIQSNYSEGIELEYRMESNDLCTLIDSETGQISCTPTHQTITGSPNPTSNKQAINKSIIIEAREEVDESFVTKGTTFVFTLIPVNNQAYFTGQAAEGIEPIEILANEIWNLTLEGNDLEMDYPLNFTVFVEPADEGLVVEPFNALQFEQQTNTSGYLYFQTEEGYATNTHAHDWLVTINLTDSFGLAFNRSASTITFNLSISPTNFNPYFLNNFSDSPEGIQNGNFTYLLEAEDPDEDDILNFEILSSSSYPCQVDFPWNLTVLNQNATNASALINTTLTNDHVICRYVNLRVYDNEGGEEIIPDVFFNITNVNDPPVIHEYSEHGSIYEQTAYTFADFIYQVNASDPDELTYNSDEYANLTYYTNNSLFNISEDGLLNFSIKNASLVGIHFINITVSDGEFNDSKTMQLTIEFNNPPFINLSNNQNFQQYDDIILIINGTDLDGDNLSLVFESLTDFSENHYDLEILSDELLGGERITQWLLNLTELDMRLSNEQVGNHQLNISLINSVGSFNENSSKVLNFTISSVNDPPFFVDPSGSHEPHNITISEAVASRELEKTLFARDYDLLHDPSETLTFEIVNYTASLQNLSLDKLSYGSGSYDNLSLRRAVLLFTPSTLETNAYITLRVSDSQGLNDTQTINFSVEQPTEDPIITFIRPYYNETNNVAIDEFRSVGVEDDKENLSLRYEVNISFLDNCFAATLSYSEYFDDPYLFDAQAIIDTDTLPENQATFTWVLNNQIQEVITNALNAVNTYYYLDVSIIEHGINNLTLYIEDERSAVISFTWLINFDAINHDIAYCNGSLENLEVNGTTTWNNYFSNTGNPATQRFYWYEEDLNKDGKRMGGVDGPTILQYTPIFLSPCSLVDFSISGDDITVIPQGGIGQCIGVVFEATMGDPSRNAMSHAINITVIDDAQQDTQDLEEVIRERTTTTAVPVPFREEVDVPKPLTILFPGNVTTYANRTISVPIELHNTWDQDLRGISISADVPGQNVTKSLSKDYIASLNMNQKESLELILSNYREDGPYEVIINVSVTEPEFTDSASILISSLERTGIGDDVRVKVTFARDLLGEHPECQELNYYLDQSTELLNQGRIEEASNMINSVINGCRHLLNQEEEVRRESPGLVQRSISLGEEHTTQILIWTAILTLLSILLFVSVGLKQKFFSK